MFGYFYPENGERFLESMSFASAEEAITWFRDKRSMWQEIRPAGERDMAAFINPVRGDIVVVREIGANNDANSSAMSKM